MNRRVANAPMYILLSNQVLKPITRHAFNGTFLLLLAAPRHSMKSSGLPGSVVITDKKRLECCKLGPGGAPPGDPWINLRAVGPLGKRSRQPDWGTPVAPSGEVGAA